MSAARLLLHLGALTGALLGFVPGRSAGQLSGTLVVFPPRLEARFRDDYGVDEQGVLREAIVAALARALAPVTLPRPLGARILIENVLPTRPTRAQTDADPGMATSAASTGAAPRSRPNCATRRASSSAG